MRRIAIGISLLISTSLVHASDRKFASYAQAVIQGVSVVPAFSPVDISRAIRRLPVPRRSSADLRDLKALEHALSEQLETAEQSLALVDNRLATSPRNEGLNMQRSDLDARITILYTDLNDVQLQIIAFERGDEGEIDEDSDASGE